MRGPETTAHAESVGHHRWFRPEDEYADLATNPLRNADGTGLLLVPAEPVAPGQLRLAFTYHRHGGGRTLRQAGSSEPEHAVLDVPWPVRGSGGDRLPPPPEVVGFPRR